MLRPVVALCFSVLGVLVLQSAYAAVPYTFTNGEAANASEVNANFTALSDQIDQLQAQLTALQNFAGQPTQASLAGSYHIFSVGVDVDDLGGENYGVAGLSEAGTAVFNSDGTGSISSTEYYRQLHFSDTLTAVGAPGGGSLNIHSTDVWVNPSNNGNVLSMSWSLSGNTVTVTTVDGDTLFTIAGGKLLVSGINDSEGVNGILMLVKD